MQTQNGSKRLRKGLIPQRKHNSCSHTMCKYFAPTLDVRTNTILTDRQETRLNFFT